MKVETFFDFCSGIGGGRLGLEQAGLKSVGYSDTSRLSVATYQQLFDTQYEKNFGNLKKIKCEELPNFDLLIAGFPCQTFSVIGRKEGFNDDRGQIIFHLCRIINETRPKVFILENVRGLVTHDKGETLKIILAEFEKIGYSVTYKVLTSLEYGVPQMRQRVYFIGFDSTKGLSAKDFEWPNTEERPDLADYLIDSDNNISEENYNRFFHYLKNPTNKGEYIPEDFLDEENLIIDTRMSDLRLYRQRVPTLRSHRDGIFYVKNHSLKELTGYEALLLQGFPKKYADKVKSTVTNRHLLMQAGNAMTINVIKKLGECIIRHLEKGDKKMTTWQEFERNATEYLNKTFSKYASFTHEGESNSEVSDIHVLTKSGKEFYVEAKQSSAQSGQFVLKADTLSNTFSYSSGNKTPKNSYSQEIMDFLNSNFDDYKDPGTAGVDISFPNCSQIYSKWIISMYKNKGVKYIITDDFTIIPIDNFEKFFNVTAKYRVKKSGSSNTGKANIEKAKKIIETKYGISDFQVDGTKLFAYSSEDLHDERFTIGTNEFMISERPAKYEVRKLSNTFNANVIFSIKLKPNMQGMSQTEFISELN